MNWSEIHPQIKDLCKNRFDNQFYADCILIAMTEISSKIRDYVIQETGREYDGVDLIRQAFSFNYNSRERTIERAPIISFVNNLNSSTNRNLQDGYMNIFVGAISAFRNTKAHQNMTPNRIRTIHMLFICSLLFYKLDESNMEI